MKTDSINACPKCGATVPPEAPQGLCPQCVFAAAAAPEAAPTATSQIPSLERLAVAFPQLQIIELIGRGGMGFVFKARQPHLARFVALKLLPDSLARDPQFAERFNREGRVLARLNHPNIVSIFDFGQAGGFYYLMMEYVDGVNLRQAMQAGRFSPAEALTIVPKICEALQFAHEEGILHRDIKPENILLDAKGRVKIADFGIAKLVGEEHSDVSLTATGAALGTMHYMAPEQIEKPATVDHRADIYSLGVVFYELLTGELPLGRFGPPSAKTPVDSRVDDVVMRTLEREREKRFQSAGEMGTTVEHLTEVGAGARPSATPPPSVAPVEDFILCHPHLPRMAQFITVFALLVVPALWFVGLMTMDTTPHPNAYAEFVQVMTRMGIFWGELLTTVLLFIGGWKLRALKKSGPRLISVALWINMVLIAFVIGGLVLTENLVPTGEAGDKPLAVGEAVLGALQFGALIFQIIALVWLRRNRAVLNDIFQSAATPRGPHGTMVVPPSAVVASIPAWSLKAISSAAMVGLSLLLPLLSLAVLLLKPYRYEEAPAVISFLYKLTTISLLSSIPAFLGTILGWMALSDVSVSGGRLRGAVFAVFAALAWPVLLLSGLTIWLVVAPIRNFSESIPFASFLLMLVPAGLVTFIIWAIYTTTRKATGQPAPQRRGVLKWIFLGLMLSALGFVALSAHSKVRRDRAYAEANKDRLPTPPVAVADTDPTPRIGFTITAVELREVQGVRWLAIDYLDDVHGDVEKSFPWETTIPGFKAAIRTSEFLGGDTNAPVRHQRVEYRVPDSLSRDKLEMFRDLLTQALKQKSFRLEPGEEKLLFELLPVEGGGFLVGLDGKVLTGLDGKPMDADAVAAFGGSLKARIKVGPPLKDSSEQPLAFGPVMERVVPSFTAIELHSGRVKSVPASLSNLKSSPEKDVAICDWIQRQGLDIAYLGQGTFYNSGQDMKILTREEWNDFSPAQLAASLHPNGKEVGGKAEDKIPFAYTYGFKTRDGRLGLLQITDYTDKQAGMKIRYKLAQAATNNSTRTAAGTTSTNASIGWLRGTWIYDKEYSAQKTAELRAVTATPQKSVQDIVSGVQNSVATNKGVPDVAKLTGDMTALTMGMMTTMKDSLELQLILDLFTGTQLTFDEAEMRSISRLAPPAATPYDKIMIVNPTTIHLRYYGTNDSYYYRDGERFRMDTKDPNLTFAIYFKRVSLTNNPPTPQP